MKFFICIISFLLLTQWFVNPSFCLARDDIEKDVLDLKNSYLETELKIRKSYEDNLDKLTQENILSWNLAKTELIHLNEINKERLEALIEKRTSEIVGQASAVKWLGWGIILVLGFFFGKDYFKYKRIITDTNDLHKHLKQELEEKEKELHSKFNPVILHEPQEPISPIDQAKYLDFEHRLYYSYIYLPITKNIKKHKYSLYKLGVYWLKMNENGRALLRFQEIERRQFELDERNIYQVRIGISKLLNQIATIEERFLGKETSDYFHKYGTSYHGCAEEMEGHPERDELINNSLYWYKRALKVTPARSNTYYNMGLLYSKFWGKNRTGITLYKLALRKMDATNLSQEKKQKLYKAIYRNIACCQVRSGDYTPYEIINTLEHIPEGDEYWQEVASDPVLMNYGRIENEPEYGILLGFILTKSSMAL